MKKQTKLLQTGCLTCALQNPLWTQYNCPQCIYCSARLIQRLGQLKSPTTDEITARRRVVLAAAIDYGHAEIEIRRLAKLKTLAYEPVKG